MIQQAELRRLGGRWGVDQDVVERDYVLGWALYGLCQRPLLRETLVFKGGTALRKAYFADYRFSADLDFTGRQPAAQEVLRSEIEAAATTVEQRSGIQFRPVRWEKTLDVSGQEAYSARLEYVGPTDRRAGSLARLKVDITFYEEVVLPPVAKALLHPYSDADDCQTELLVYQLEEMVAEKLRALFRRRRARDVYDLWQLTGKYRQRLDATLLYDTFAQKCRYKGFPVVGSDVLLSSDLWEATSRSWAASLRRQVRDLPPVEQIWAELGESLAELTKG
ncbi:MAG: nucleotidyl transferase AbiEii/AbiGii toxin family protein [Planctomycetota bacterium]